ncbi:MAG TPA: hypothetical protein VN455_01240 [Methanotrichaceae archaeon]|nr:hypothetical protein [Methanotrichaceae archaeon]
MEDWVGSVEPSKGYILCPGEERWRWSPQAGPGGEQHMGSGEVVGNGDRRDLGVVVNRIWLDGVDSP